jgi:hypothetical protein
MGSNRQQQRPVLSAPATRRWQLDEHKLVKFLMKIEDGYPNNP